MVHRLLVTVSCICCGLVIASFGMFARDQLAGASEHQQQALGAATVPVGTATITQGHAQPRRFIDGAAGVLTSPFDSIVQTDSDWVGHIMPTTFALLVYGLGLGYIARFSRGWA